MIELSSTQLWIIAMVIFGPIYVYGVLAIGMKLKFTLRSIFAEQSQPQE
jgi:hypothetical protein